MGNSDDMLERILAGGPSRYPGFLITGLPPPELTLTYPPHLEIVNHGYRLGRGRGRSKKEAEQQAAQDALELLE